MFAPNIQSQHLPSINSSMEAARLGYGTFTRLLFHSAVYYGGRGFIAEKLRGKKGSMDSCEREAMCYVLSMSAEVGVSVLWAPMKYLAAVNTPRFLLDYLFTSWSDTLSILDRFHAGKFASFAMYAFASDPMEDWNMDFFAWQVPSIVLTIGKLIARRRRVGAEKCRSKRVLGVLLLQVLLRAYMSTFSLTVPESGGEAVEAMVVTLLEGIATSYLARHTWPFPFDDMDSLGLTSSSSATDETHSQPSVNDGSEAKNSGDALD